MGPGSQETCSDLKHIRPRGKGWLSMFHHRITGLAVAGLLSAVPSTALAADVTVRVEGAKTSLVSERTVSTTSQAVVKDGDASHGCPGDSAAGALEQATKGRWTAAYSDGLGYYVTGIAGEPWTVRSGGIIAANATLHAALAALILG